MSYPLDMIDLLTSIKASNRCLAILVDPEKTILVDIPAFAKAIPTTISLLKKKLELDLVVFFVGGSTIAHDTFNEWVKTFKENTTLQVIIFPGSHRQLSEHADGLLFLNLISGRNPEFLIAQQVQAAAQLKKTSLQIIPTGYLLIDGGTTSAVERVSQTQALAQENIAGIVDHAFAGKLMGNQLIYLEAGSGAKRPVSNTIVSKVCRQVKVPVIVGGGLKSMPQIKAIYNAGAKMVVVGTAIEENIDWIG